MSIFPSYQGPCIRSLARFLLSYPVKFIKDVALDGELVKRLQNFFETLNHVALGALPACFHGGEKYFHQHLRREDPWSQRLWRIA
jgi:hypothetical protein